MLATSRILQAGALLALTVVPALGSTPPAPTGIWLDHTGRGAVEIVNCGANLCGKVVWLKDKNDAKGCGLQIIGDAKPVAASKWDNGWIYDPDDDRRYSVELTLLGTDKLKVLGYMGTKLFSETMIWTRAPADLQQCGTTASLAPSAEAKSQSPQSAALEPRPSVEPRPSADAAEGDRAATPQEPAAKAPKEQRAEGQRARRCQLEIAAIRIDFPCP
jgi:uncharacterized protein (DUF2147 family)